ncbi:hypothetical protein M8A51_20830 [Schlegelella sp. S2-27]|uniref:Uncharacterized protein n=1 Tax=Caldimonas mangrovi TaxID=2944811 RepID=A0ABT0YTA2_9BURK|nr:hypothetical protein [Caldimonas mangrovi]MCM5681980.1 hypothetical protein [Caldimonas mangrovi]
MKTWSVSMKDSLVSGGTAGVLSAAVLAWRGRHDTRSAVAPLNATSHIVWGDESLHVDRPTVRHTLTGTLLHAGSAVFWGVLFERLLGRERRQDHFDAVVRSAVKATAAAAVVDLCLVPRRLTPGFERRLSGRSLWLVYGGLAAGLVTGAWLLRRTGR